MRIVVKNTTSWRIADLLCPHTCRGCGRLGTVFCGCCKNNILEKRVNVCPLCKHKLDVNEKQRCGDCEIGFDEVFVGGWREGALSKLVAEYKYKSVRAAGVVLAEVLNASIPERWGADKEVIVVPLPTIGKHVRERGFDHTLCLAKKLARRRGWKVERLLVRKADTVQVGTKAAERQEQAERAYEATRRTQKGVKYLLLDDVWTTGASAMAAERAMRGVGAEDVNMVVIEVGK